MGFLISARRFLFESATGWIDRMIAADETRATETPPPSPELKLRHRPIERVEIDGSPAGPSTDA